MDWDKVADIVAQVPALAVLSYLVWHLESRSNRQMEMLVRLLANRRLQVSDEEPEERPHGRID